MAQSISETFQKLSAGNLHFVESIPLYTEKFETHHPQGIKVYGNRFYLTSVEGNLLFGHGYLTEFYWQNGHAAAIRQLRFDERDSGLPLDHAGGFDGDHESLYIPLSAYRPIGPGHLLKVNLADFTYETLGKMYDHLGAAALDTDGKTFRLFTWGARGVYTSGADLNVKIKIKGHAWQYQDCKSVGPLDVICSAKKGLIWPKGELHLLHFNDHLEASPYTIIHRIEVPHLQPDGSKGGRRPLTYNAMDVQKTETGLRFFFVPHDQENSHLIIMDAVLP
jgi:hypothetical protein